MLISTFYEELFMSEQNDNTESNFEPGCGIYRCTPLNNLFLVSVIILTVVGVLVIPLRLNRVIYTLV